MKTKEGFTCPPILPMAFASSAGKRKYSINVLTSMPLKMSAVSRWNDPDIAIDWPIKDPILSEKDAKSSFLKNVELPP
jgi:dTDP-4-dehydrorhamnose 3,5-epimerase-like enzyme